MSDQAELTRIRTAVEQADEALASALDARARAIKEFVALRTRNPEGYYALARRAEVLTHLRQRVLEFPAGGVEAVIREVLSACDAIVRPVRIAFAGPEGGRAHEAARKHFGASAQLASLDEVAAVISEVARGESSFGVVALETSSDGAVSATLDALAASDVKICAELTVPVSFHLVSRTGNGSDFDKIYLTPSARQACERWLRAHCPRAALIEVPTLTVAAQLAGEDHGAAAIATQTIAEKLSLSFVKEHIEDEPGIEVRFAVLGGELPARTGADRTMLAVALHDSPGALYKALKPFADRGVNLTRLESRPARGEPWRYVFFVELDGHLTDRPVLTATEELRGASRWLKVLGSYPRPA
jgi:chorismate mutase/prephenate dehydratase